MRLSVLSFELHLEMRELEMKWKGREKRDCTAGPPGCYVSDKTLFCRIIIELGL